MSTLPIGIFDSGVGGLTVLRAVRDRLPHESVIYLGDTARVPYGTKSPATIERYAVEDASFLVEKGVKMLLVACNTASAMARERLRAEFQIPLLSVLGPGARMAARVTRNGRIGVIATEATIESGAYARAIEDASGDKQVEIFARACPLFVPLVEEGETDSAITRLVAEQYLAPLRAQEIDTLVLGCTHYPLLKPLLQELAGPQIQLVDSAVAMADQTAQVLTEIGLANPQRHLPNYEYYVTDIPLRFQTIGERFLGRSLANLQQVKWG